MSFSKIVSLASLMMVFSSGVAHALGENNAKNCAARATEKVRAERAKAASEAVAAAQSVAPATTAK